MPSRLLAGTAGIGDVLGLTVLQGIGTGLMSTLCYAFAVRVLGSGRASVGGAVSPVLTAVVAVPVFGEHIGLGLTVALALIVVGVAAFGSSPPTRRHSLKIQRRVGVNVSRSKAESARLAQI